MQFLSQVLRLKEALRVESDKEAAETLGIKPTTFNEKKRRGAFPEKELRALAQQRPELGINVEYVLTGGRLSARQHSNQEKARQFTQALDASSESQERLQDLLERAGVAMASGNASRARVYDDINEVLRLSSDETVALVLTLAVKLFRAEQMENGQSRAAMGTGKAATQDAERAPTPSRFEGSQQIFHQAPTGDIAGRDIVKGGGKQR